MEITEEMARAIAQAVGRERGRAQTIVENAADAALGEGKVDVYNALTVVAAQIGDATIGAGVTIETNDEINRRVEQAQREDQEAPPTAPEEPDEEYEVAQRLLGHRRLARGEASRADFLRD